MKELSNDSMEKIMGGDVNWVCVGVAAVGIAAMITDPLALLFLLGGSVAAGCFGEFDPTIPLIVEEVALVVPRVPRVNRS